jgi:hypothetical protein
LQWNSHDDTGPDGYRQGGQVARSDATLIERFLQALRAKLLSRQGTFAEAEKLTIEAYRRSDDTFDITLTVKTR